MGLTRANFTRPQQLLGRSDTAKRRWLPVDCISKHQPITTIFKWHKKWVNPRVYKRNQYGYYWYGGNGNLLALYSYSRAIMGTYTWLVWVTKIVAAYNKWEENRPLINGVVALPSRVLTKLHTMQSNLVQTLTASDDGPGYDIGAKVESPSDSLVLTGHVTVKAHSWCTPNTNTSLTKKTSKDVHKNYLLST